MGHSREEDWRTGRFEMVRAGPSRWTPLELKSALLGWWDAGRSDLITQSGGAVSSWKDRKGAYNVAQATSASQPAYSATGFNNRPVVTFDGTDDELTLGSVPFPMDASGFEIWALVDQTALVADTTSRWLFGWGAGSNNTVRIRRIESGGANRVSATVGTGAATVTPASPVADFSGRCVVRLVCDGTNARTELNGVVGTASACVPSLGSTRTRIGAQPAAATASEFWQGGVNNIAVTRLLSAGQAAQMYAFQNARKG